ncbi:hypothetical protein MAP_2853c [Mycobacterium avium subsp. paratuberculosis K-10]|uniref:Uncharacterized protein n=1 Tax=Mycolicibacterium paratuberculosis (strain ATCC BAA-968 / K-10) TaxID=262316 RepID=Q73W08_MYCPA|nr:hypothetical protein MAP_2853c [Mycobacterium avium subsp. paratuberculosis K-10]AGL35901.1 conserved arginine rich protein [Mycobacterium avium subsp. paratuberculosis MAP4]
MDVGVALPGDLVDQLGVQIVHGQHVPAPHLVERVRKVHERNENRQRHAQVNVERRRDQPERGQHQHRRHRHPPHHPGRRALAGQVVAHPVAHRVRQPPAAAIADELNEIGPGAAPVLAHGALRTWLSATAAAARPPRAPWP